MPRASASQSIDENTEFINTFGAHLQKVLDNAPDGIDDSAIFSSWFGPMVTGTVKDGGIEGSFEEHVLAAVSYISCHPRTILDLLLSSVVLVPRRGY
jgi:hypothetical protein